MPRPGSVFGPLYVAQAFGWDVATFGPVGPITLKHGIKLHADAEWEVLADQEPHDAVIIPGGWGAEKLRSNKVVLDFIRSMHAAGKVVAAICHGPWVLCSCNVSDPERLVWLTKVQERLDPTRYETGIDHYWRRRKMTCYSDMKDDIINAGAEYVEAPVVVDGNVVTSPHYRYVSEFMRAIKELVKK